MFVCFFHAEEGVDGETLLLVLLASCGTVEQYKAYGLKTVRQQMQLIMKRLFCTEERSGGSSSHESLDSETISSKDFVGKLILTELNSWTEGTYHASLLLLV